MSDKIVEHKGGYSIFHSDDPEQLCNLDKCPNSTKPPVNTEYKNQIYKRTLFTTEADRLVVSRMAQQLGITKQEMLHRMINHKCSASILTSQLLPSDREMLDFIAKRDGKLKYRVLHDLIQFAYINKVKASAGTDPLNTPPQESVDDIPELVKEVGRVFDEAGKKFTQQKIDDFKDLLDFFTIKDGSPSVPVDVKEQEKKV
jgi:hypothetical protein